MERNIALDRLKLVLAFMVIGIHAGFLGDLTALGKFLTVEGIFRIAVPIFFVINGYFFFYVIEKAAFLFWFKRVAILYLTWMLFYSWFWFSTPELSFFWVTEFLINIVIGYHHLWYLAGLLGAGLITMLVRNYSTPFILCVLIIAFIIGVLIQYLGNYYFLHMEGIGVHYNYIWLHRNALFLSFPFFCIGYLINKHSWYEQMSFKNLFIISSISGICLLGESFFNFYNESRFGGFDNYFSLIIVCPFVFMMFVRTGKEKSGKSIALYSSAIFLIHPFVLAVLNKYLGLEETLGVITVAIISSFCAYFIVVVNRRLKFLL